MKFFVCFMYNNATKIQIMLANDKVCLPFIGWLQL